MTLEEAIAEHRSMYREELRGRMTQRHVPADTEPIRIGEATVDVTDSGPLGGMPFSSDLNRRLGPPNRYGERYPWAHSWSFLRRACRNDHPGHTERPVFGGALCWQVVAYSVVHEFDVQTISRLMDIPVESVERHLRNAFAWIVEDIDRKQRIRNARDPLASEEPTPTRISLLQCDVLNRAVQDFVIEQRIWEGQVGIMRRKLDEEGAEEVPVLIKQPVPHYVKLTRPQWEQHWSWEREWQRRQAELAEHRRECDRCRRAA